jgi:hypothetical protein
MAKSMAKKIAYNATKMKIPNMQDNSAPMEPPASSMQNFMNAAQQVSVPRTNPMKSLEKFRGK